MPLEELRAYRPAPDRRHDFATFWDQTLAEARVRPLLEKLEPVPYVVDDLAVHRLDYEGWDGARITCWLLAVRSASRPSSTTTVTAGTGARSPRTCRGRSRATPCSRSTCGASPAIAATRRSIRPATHRAT